MRRPGRVDHDEGARARDVGKARWSGQAEIGDVDVAQETDEGLARRAVILRLHQAGNDECEGHREHRDGLDGSRHDGHWPPQVLMDEDG